MRNKLLLLGGGGALALFAAGCAGPEQKLGRGISNTFEVVRLGEMRSSIEQENLFDAPNAGYTIGVVRGFDRPVARTGVGLWEVLTFPIPNHDKSYGPISAAYDKAVYPGSYKPNWLGGDSTMETDSTMGMSGGDVAPFIPGSRFRIFDN